MTVVAGLWRAWISDYMSSYLFAFTAYKLALLSVSV